MQKSGCELPSNEPHSGGLNAPHGSKTLIHRYNNEQGMPHHFKKGQPRPLGAGRRKGTLNRSTQSVGQFCREVLETAEFQDKWRDYFSNTPLHQIEPKLLALAFAYAYGRPRERIDVDGAESGLLEPKVIIYLPHNGRNSQGSDILP